MTLHVNGSPRAVEVAPDARLLWVLRESLNLTGTKYGCGEGQCGACTVLVDGRATRSCTARVSAMAGRRIETIESLARDGSLHPVQQAFLDHEALQCGFCTPGMIMTAVALLKSAPAPTPAAIVKAMDRNMCRCGTYARIVAAVQQASRSVRERA